MSISSAFLYRFLEDAWDLLPTEDRELFEAYWSGQLQIAGNLEQKAIEASLSTQITTVPVFLTERWNRYVMNDETCDLFQQVDQLTLIGTSDVGVSRETAFFETLSVSNASGQISHTETIQLFDDSVRNLRYGNIISGTLSVSIIGFSTSGAGGQITATDTLTLAGAFEGVQPGMILRVNAAVPSTPVGIYRVKSRPDDDTIIIDTNDGDFGVASATSVLFEVEEPLVEYTPNRDFATNLALGTLQALPDGRIPPDQLLRVRYQHEKYAEGVDYEVDTVNQTVRRTTTSAIASGSTVSATYTYNGTATLQLVGDRGSTSGSVLTDANKDFSNLLSSRTLTITSGNNAGTYTINAVLSPTSIQVVETFPVDQETDVEYSINAFPHGVRVSRSVASIPALQDLVDNPTYYAREGVDFRVEGGILALRSPLRLSQLGPEADREREAWAEVTKIDSETPYRNFGVLIDFFRKNSEEYKLALQGLWYTFWTGSTPGNLQRGLHILLGLPFAREAGTVFRVNTATREIVITQPTGSFITYSIPDDLTPTVTEGQEVARFDALTNGVRIIDRNNEPGFVASRLGRSGIQPFLTDNATRGAGDTDETKALSLLEHHLFLPQVVTEALAAKLDVNELLTFLDNMKPQWTEYVFSINAEADETIQFTEEFVTPSADLDLTTTVASNSINRAGQGEGFFIQSASALPSIVLVNGDRTTGEILSGGTQAAGNFRDTTVDFADLGIDRGDVIVIREGLFYGVWDVIARIDSTTLSISIPDADIVFASNIDYTIFTEEQSLDNDAINLRGEHFVRDGTDFPAPSVLNTATDIDLNGTLLKNEEVEALLLLDILNTGNEVQAITDANVLLNEFDVASPPGVVTREHQIASCSLQRTNNMGPTVTDVYAI